MESAQNIAEILPSSLNGQGSIDAKETVGKIPADSKKLVISLPIEVTANVLEEALDSKRFETIFVDGPITFNYFDIQRVAYKEKQHKVAQVLVNYHLRLHSQVQELKKKITEAASNGNTIISITVNTIQTNALISTVNAHDVDLVFYLTGQDATSVQGWSTEKGNSTGTKFVILAGSLKSEIAFTVQFRNQMQGENVTSIQVGLSNGEVLSTVIKGGKKATRNEDLEIQKNNFASLQDSIKVARLFICATQSLLTEKRVTIKYAQNGVVPARTIGTAVFLDVGFFIPTHLNKNVAITGMYSGKQDQIRTLFNRIAATGEPVEYQATYEELMNHKYSGTPRPIFYTPSIPGTRKDKEMLDALKAGYIVLAEKPAFANSDLAKNFLKLLDEESKKRLFFGWHYQHHHVFNKLWKDVLKNTFGKINHIRTYFSVPMILAQSRIFDPSQGGAGVDIYSYCLHFTLRLIGFENTFEVTQSKIESAQSLDINDPKLSKIDFILDTKIKFGNGVTADLSATFDSKTVMHSEAEVFFEDGTKILCKEFVHFQNIISLGFSPAFIQKASSSRWEDYITLEDRKHAEYINSSYDQQVEFMRRQATGEDNYDLNKDVSGLGIEANIKLQEIIDDVFEKGGFQKKPGA